MSWHIPNKAMDVFENYPSEKSMKIGHTKPYPSLENYEKMLEKHRNKEEKEEK